MRQTSLLRDAVLLLLFFTTGCLGGGVTIQPAEEGPPTVEVTPRAYGRSCTMIDVAYKPDDTVTVSVAVAQDGTSDWSLSRVFGFIGDVVSQTPIIGGQRQMQEPQEPAKTDSCGQLLVGNGEPDDALEPEEPVE